MAVVAVVVGVPGSSSRARPFAEVTFRTSETRFVLKITNISRSGYLPRFHQILRLPQKDTKSDTPRSSNAVPATKSDSHD